MKKIVFISIFFLLSTRSTIAQTTNCGTAVLQLQNYAAQVNNLYNKEYWTVIPNIRCPAYDQWGRPFNPQIVQNCRVQMLIYLNHWYGQQCAYVNNYYIQIVRGCSINPNDGSNGPAPSPINTDDENMQIDTNQIEELTAGIDEDKALRISIPKTAAGFKP